MLTKKSYLIFFIIIFFSLLIGFFLGTKNFLFYKKKIAIIPTPIQTSNNIHAIPVIKKTDTDKALDYVNQEYMLLKQQTIGNTPVSYVFGIKVNPFHKDWVCENMGFTQEGLIISCSQKLCRATQDIKWPNKATDNKYKECDKEYSLREYPYSFQQFEIKAKEFLQKEGITNINQIINASNSAKTRQGISYIFNKKPLAKYTNSYTYTFYSPIEIENVVTLNKGELVGNLLTVQYSIETTIMADNISDKMVTSLAEKVMDSIQFIEPNLLNHIERP